MLPILKVDDEMLPIQVLPIFTTVGNTKRAVG